jgi:hypothetical protein
MRSQYNLKEIFCDDVYGMIEKIVSTCSLNHEGNQTFQISSYVKELQCHEAKP